MNTETTEEDHSFWRLLTRLMRFQLKLLLDGFRDLVFSPLSLLVVLIGLLSGRREAHRHFEDLMALGRRSDEWINLFGQYDGPSADQLLQPLEDRLQGELHRKGWLGKKPEQEENGQQSEKD